MPTIMHLLCAFLASAITCSAAIFCTDNCKASGRRCSDPYSYQYCVNMTDYAVGTIAPKKCPDGTICTVQGSFPCKVGTITTTPAPVTVPSCSAPAKFPTDSCHQYLECIQVMWFWQLVTQTCPSGQGFDPSLRQCSDVYSCSTTESPATPKCDGPGRLPGPMSNQYYECEQIWFQWQPQLKTCPDGQTFDRASQQCLADIVTTPGPDLPKCDGAGRHPGPTNNQYYECELIWFQWQPQLKTCPDGQTFDGASQQCLGDIVTTPGPDLPKCDGAGRHPGPTNNQYYECELIWFQWQPQLKNCPDGQHFDVSGAQCVSTNGNTAIVPTSTVPTGVALPQCNGGGRHPGPSTHQYYECVLIWFQWQAELKTCPDEQIFDVASTVCVTTTKSLIEARGPALTT